MHYKTQNYFFKFSIHLSLRKSQENYRQINGKSKASLWRNLSTSTPPNFLGQSFALQLQFTIYIFFRKAVMWKLFDTRFSYKHCNFLRVCLLFKMASKTMTRSILPHTAYIMCLCFFAECHATKSLQQPRAGLQCAQGSKAISQFLDGCAPINLMIHDQKKFRGDKGSRKGTRPTKRKRKKSKSQKIKPSYLYSIVLL